MVKYDQDFKWGTASSGPQSEGNTNKYLDSIWDKWFQEQPERFHQFIGPEKASNVYEQFNADVLMMKKIGLNSFRTSIQWTRIFEDISTNKINKLGIEFYQNYFKALKNAGIQVIVNLFHYDLPVDIFNKYEGFKSKAIIPDFVKYAEVCFKYFGEYVDKWSTFNEPMAYAKESYLDNRIYPCELSFTDYIIVNYNIVLAHKAVVKLFRDLKISGEIGIILDCLVPAPRSTNQFDLKAAKLADLLINRIYLDPCILGTYPEDFFDFINQEQIELVITDTELTLIKDYPVDFVGCNYYRPLRVKASTLVKNQNTPTIMDHFFENYLLPNGRINQHRGWEIYPKGLYEIGMRIKNEYNNIPWYVSENGMGVENEEQYRKDGIIQDDYRINFIAEHLYWLNQAIDSGSNCFGYHLWTFIDNWSWLNAYKNRYGFIEYNLTTEARIPKKSAYWIEEVIKNGGFNEQEYEFFK